MASPILVIVLFMFSQSFRRSLLSVGDCAVGLRVAATSIAAAIPSVRTFTGSSLMQSAVDPVLDADRQAVVSRPASTGVLARPADSAATVVAHQRKDGG